MLNEILFLLLNILVGRAVCSSCAAHRAGDGICLGTGRKVLECKIGRGAGSNGGDTCSRAGG